KLAVIAGQVDLSRLPGSNVFFSDPYNQFMNTALWQNTASFAVAPYAGLSAGLIYMPTKWLSGASMVVDSYGTPNYSGCKTAFHSPEGTSILQSLKLTIKPFNLDGHQRFGFGYSTRTYYQLDDYDRLAISGQITPSFSRLNFPTLQPGKHITRPQDIIPRAILAKAIEPRQTNSKTWALWDDCDQYFYQCR